MTQAVSIDQESLLFTGGGGLLGRAFRSLIPRGRYPTSKEFDVRNIEQMSVFIETLRLSTVVHAAAATSPPKVDQDPMLALDTNIVGTANLVRLCMTHALKLIYISTDYVFRGDGGAYREEDPVYPVNKYAWSKLGGECAVRMYDNSLIVRTSFGPDVFPYTKAMVDQWTSREGVSQIAAKIAALLSSPATGVVHVGGARRSVWDYARSLNEKRGDITPISIRDLPFAVPVDTSLCTDRYCEIVGRSEGVDERTPDGPARDGE